MSARNRWAIKCTAGFYAGTDFTSAGVIGVEGHICGGVVGSKPWPAKVWMNRKSALDCIEWLGPVGVAAGARVVEVEAVRSWVEVEAGK